MSVSYTVDFASLLLLGPHETMLIAAASAWSQCTFRIKEREPGPPHAVQHGVARHHGAAGRAAPTRALGGTARARLAARWAARPLVGAATVYFLVNTLLVATAIALSTGQPIVRAVERELPLERAELLRRRAASAALGAVLVDSVGLLAGAAGGGAALPDLPDLQGLPGPHRGRAAARRADLRSAPGHDRGARARHRREGPDHADPHPARADLRGGPRARARHVGERDPGRDDGGAAARHRQARRARAHPVEARAR